MAYADEFEKANKEYEAFTKSDENAKWEKAEKAAEFKRKYDVDREKLEKIAKISLITQLLLTVFQNEKGVTPESRKHITDISDAIISNSDAVSDQDDAEE